MVYSKIPIRDRLNDIIVDIDVLSKWIEEIQDSHKNEITAISETNTAQMLKLEESLSNYKKNQKNINIIQLITCGVSIWLSTIR